MLHIAFCTTLLALASFDSYENFIYLSHDLKAMKLIAAYPKQGVPYIIETTQPYLISSISDGHRNDVPAKRALRITR